MFLRFDILKCKFVNIKNPNPGLGGLSRNFANISCVLLRPVMTLKCFYVLSRAAEHRCKVWTRTPRPGAQIDFKIYKMYKKVNDR